MSEIISLHFGTFGSNIAHEFWNQIAQQQIVTPKGQLKQHPQGRLLFFQQKKNGTHKARSIFYDMDSRKVEKPDSCDKHRLHDKNNTIIAKRQSRGLFAETRYCLGSQAKQQILAIINKEVEKCDRLSGFLLTNAVQGGTGSGFYSLVLGQLRQYYCDKMVQSHTLFPQIKGLNSPLHIYNSVFATFYAIEQADFQILLDNDSAIRMLHKQCNVKNDYKQINKVFARSIVQQTSSYRFPGLINSNQRKLATNMILFPRLKFFYQSMSEPSARIKCMPLDSALNDRNFLFGQKHRRSNEFYTISIHSRDEFAYEQQINKSVAQIMREKNIRPTQWISSNYHISCSNNVNEKWGKSTSILTNSSSMINPFQKIAQMFTSMFRRKAFIHHYISCGMDEIEFTEAESNLCDLISEYRQTLLSHRL